MTEPYSTFADALEGLLDENQAFTRELVQHFSDISPKHLNALMDIWGAVSTKRKQFFLTTLKKYLERNILFCFDLLARRMLQDEDAIVRATAIRLLSDCEDEDIIPTLLEIAMQDAETATRAEAVTALGKYVLKGELDEISDTHHDTVEETLIDLYHHSTNVNLRQRAVEALGFSSRKEVVAFIREAWQHESPMWKASAVSAMGRSYDRQWTEEILESLIHESEIIRLAAVKAAGELSLPHARPILLGQLKEERDEAVFQAIVWSLSQIGGEDVREYLLSLVDQYENEEHEQIAFVEDALANLDFTEATQDFNMLNFTPEDMPNGDEL